MCGILGILSENIDKNQVKSAANSLAHRGPDDSGFYFDNGLALAHRRLSILDLSKRGHQPMPDKSGTLQIVFNGEIYNFKEIRSQLEKKYDFKSNSDTEVILYAYREWGSECVKKFNGIFAFAIWDSKRKKIFLARDRAGIKPLYLYRDKNTFVFASEMKAILKMGVNPVINTGILSDYLNYQILIGDETLFKGIYSFPPAHYAFVDLKTRKIETKRYWDAEYSSTRNNEHVCAEELKSLLDESVKRQMISDVPVGAFLSGGIDSSTITALARRHSKKLHTFTAGFDVFPEEIEAAEFVAKELGTIQHNVELTSEKFIKSLPKLIWHYDSPLSFASAVPLYFISKLTKGKVTVVLTGEGSDELFAGYRRYHLIQKAISLNRKLIKLPGKSMALKAFDLFYKDPRYKKIASLALKGENPEYLTGTNSLIGKERDKLIKFEKTSKMQAQAESLFLKKKTNFTNKLLYLDFNTYLKELLMKQDKMSMAASIESRVPFLDNKIIEFANSLDSKLKLNGQVGKYILRKAVGKILPQSVIKRKKVGFTVPLNPWFRKDLQGYLKDELNSPEMNKFFHKNEVSKLLESQKSRNNSLQLWALLNFSLWRKEFFKTS